MGVIYQTILDLKDRYDYILQESKDINTRNLQEELDTFVFKSFEALRPLRSDYVVAGDLKNSEGKVYEQIGVGEFIRQKSWSDTYGSNFRPESDWSRKQFVELIRSHGDIITPHIGALKREDFGRLVQITKDLKLYDELTTSLNVDPPLTVHKHNYTKYDAIRVLKIDENRVVKLFLNTSNPEKVVYNKRIEKDQSWVSIDSLDVTWEANIPLIEDLIDYLVKLYKMAKEMLDTTKSYNAPLIAEMGTLASVYNISRRLT